MLNIPETVKALFKADGIRKNFRVQFPNGELPDITNDNIVKESVRFTESLCSQDVLKFGLTEASVLEFETVGVANMYGMTIQAGIEIDLSSLSASEIAEIAAGSWDGVYVSETNTDIGYPFFRVPYGVFRVESCPRDHQAMAHRRVKAYGFLNQALKLSPLEEKKLKTFAFNDESFTGNLLNALYGNIGYYNPEIFQELGYTKTKVASFADGDFITRHKILLETKVKERSSPYQQRTFYLRIEFNFRTCRTSGDNLYSAEPGNFSAPFDEIAQHLDANYIIAPEPSDYGGYSAYAYIDGSSSIGGNFRSGTFADLFTEMQNTGTIQTNYKILPAYYSINNVIPFSNPSITYPFTEDIPCVWPMRKTPADNSFCLRIDGCYQITAVNDDTGTTLRTWNSENLSDGAIYRYDTTEAEIPVTFNSTLQNTYNGATRYSYINSYSVQDLMAGFLELMAKFGRVNRHGNFEMLMLSDLNPEAIAPPIYERFWWDEYDVLPIGTVKYSIEAEGTEGETEYQFGDGLSIYDMTGNDALERMSTTTTAEVEAILDESFIPHLGPIAFTPIDIDMKGLPYLEAGDYLAVTAEDGMVAYSFAMRQEISGVQVLQTHIESTSGDIIESEASE